MAGCLLRLAAERALLPLAPSQPASPTPRSHRYLAGYGMAVFTNPAHLGILLVMFGLIFTSILHGDGGAVLGAGLPYWFFQPVFWNILQVGTFVAFFLPPQQ